jgi:thiol-disulfide isomerase/thioredoxin
MKKMFIGSSLIMIALIISCSKSSAPPEGAINFTLPDLDGKINSFSQFYGKPVLLNIWATWCGPCVREIPDINQIYHEYKDKNIIVLGVSVDQNADVVKADLNGKLKIDYPIWIADEDFMKQFNITSIPMTLIINKEGKVVDQFVGMQSKETFIEGLSKAL